MYKKFRWGKTTQVYVPKVFAEEIKEFVRAIDDTQDPKINIKSLTSLIKRLTSLDNLS